MIGCLVVLPLQLHQEWVAARRPLVTLLMNQADVRPRVYACSFAHGGDLGIRGRWTKAEEAAT